MKEKQQKPIYEALLKLIPRRQMVRTRDFPDAANPRQVVFSEGEDYADLTDAVLEEQKYYSKKANENSRFCYIAHQKKDGILSAKLLEEKLHSKDKKKPDPVYNPKVDEKNLSAHLKWSSLHSKALDEELVEREKLPLTGILLSVISGIVLILDLLGKTFELTNYTGDNAFLNILKSFNAGIILTCVLVAMIAVSLGLIISHTRKNRKVLTAKINKALSDMDTKDFVDFLSGFDGSDLLLPDCDTDSPIFICVLQNYSIKERYVLSAYWRYASQRQLWWIFAEATDENAPFVVPASKNYDRRFYFQKPLAKAEKRKLAEETYRGMTKISPMDDSGIYTFGVDWICRFQLKEREPIGEAEQLNEKLDKFCSTYAASYQADIKLVVRLVADLVCTYGFDFSVRRNWEYLFSDNSGDPLLGELDKQATDALNLNNKVFRNLIPEIMDVFSQDLEEIVADHPNSEQTSEYELWCIIKALKTRAPNPEDCYLSICDTLMAEFANCHQTPEDIGDSDFWRAILVKTAEVFYEKQFWWFLPTLLHNLLFFFAGRSGQRLFSENILLEIARANLLLSLQSGGDAAPVDAVWDHYAFVCAAAAERNISLDDNSSVPPAFELLQFTNQERRRYYNALHGLKERAVIEFLDCLFDMFCAVVSTNVDKARFCYSILYDKSLYEDYLEKANLAVNRKNYITTISSRLLKLLDDSFGHRISAVKSSIRYLQTAINKHQPVDELLLLIAELDVLGFNTLNFIACMLGLADDSEELSRDIYLNLGNYLLGVVFLAYHELLQPSFCNEDFKYLVTNCTGYHEPGSTVLGFLYFCDTRLTPTNDGARIRGYIQRHKAIYLESLCSLATRLKHSDLEAFITFLACISSATLEEKIPVYQCLRENIEVNFGSKPQNKMYLELISLLLNKTSIPEFAADSPAALIDRLLLQSADMVYLIYQQYYWQRATEFVGFCHKLAPKIIKACFVERLSLLIGCLLETKNSTAPETLAETARLIFNALDEDLTDKSTVDLKNLAFFLALLLTRLQEAPQLYGWTTKEQVDGKLMKVDLRLKHLVKLETEAFCTERKWTNYGIAMYLRELILSDARGWHTPEDYNKKMDSAEKTAYFITHFQTLTPLVIVEQRQLLSLPYLHMVIAFITNGGDIQHSLDERECMRKLTKDLLAIVENHRLLSEDQKTRVRYLITEYRRHTD